MFIDNENVAKLINDFLIDIILFLFSIILIIVGVLIENTAVSTICLSIGTSIIATIIVSVVSLKRLYKQERIRAMIEYWGIESVYIRRSEINPETNKLLQKANTLDISAIGLKGFRDAQGETIKERVKKGMKLRILTINPDSQILRYIDKKEGLLDGATRQSIETLIEWFNDIKRYQLYDKQIELKTYDNYPSDFYFNINGTVYTGPYQNKTSQQTITYKYGHKGKGFDYYTEYFESLWNNNDGE